MKLTETVIADIGNNTVAIYTTDNQSCIGKVMGVDEFNVKLLVVGAVGSTGGIQNKDRVSYICADMISRIVIIEQ